MRIGRIFSVPLRVSPAAFGFIALALWSGEGRRLCVMSGSILLHELFHIAAARLLHVRVIELELMPVGGAARLENLWRLRPAQVVMTALAGPLANLLLIVTAAALCQWGVLSGEYAALMIEQNAVIFIFNLLPALPTDGGRILCGLLGSRMTPSAAARIGTRATQWLAGVLLAMSAYALSCGKMNITIVAAAVFLLVSIRRERQQGECAVLESLVDRARELAQEGIMPVRWLAAGENMSVRETVMLFKPRYMHIIAVYDEALRMTYTLDERQLTEAMLLDGSLRISQIVSNVKTKKS